MDGVTGGGTGPRWVTGESPLSVCELAAIVHLQVSDSSILPGTGGWESRGRRGNRRKEETGLETRLWRESGVSRGEETRKSELRSICYTEKVHQVHGSSSLYCLLLVCFSSRGRTSE